MNFPNPHLQLKYLLLVQMTNRTRYYGAPPRGEALEKRLGHGARRVAARLNQFTSGAERTTKDAINRVEEGKFAHGARRLAGRLQETERRAREKAVAMGRRSRDRLEGSSRSHWLTQDRRRWGGKSSQGRKALRRRTKRSRKGRRSTRRLRCR